MLELIENCLNHQNDEDFNFNYIPENTNVPNGKKHDKKIKDDVENIAEEICDKDHDITFGTDYTFKRKIVWFNVIGFMALHIAAVYGLFLILSRGKLATLIYGFPIMWLSAEGITIGAHRLWTHRSFKAKTFFQIILMIFQTMAGQNCIWVWVRDHRQHHKYADTDADPHNANRGFFFCHMGWLMSKKHPLVIEMGKNIFMDDMNADKIVMFQKKHYKLLYVLFAMYLPTAIPVYLWNENWIVSFFYVYFFRYILVLHGTWTVNSIAHIYGYRPYDKNILATESVFVAFISSGEGWHNYHHVFPWDYKAAELGNRFQPTSHILHALAKLGIVYDLKQAPKEMVVSRSRRTGDSEKWVSHEYEKNR